MSSRPINCEMVDDVPRAHLALAIVSSLSSDLAKGVVGLSHLTVTFTLTFRPIVAAIRTRGNNAADWKKVDDRGSLASSKKIQRIFKDDFGFETKKLETSSGDKNPISSLDD